jgi:hypothetical protein
MSPPFAWHKVNKFLHGKAVKTGSGLAFKAAAASGEPKVDSTATA